MQSNREQLSLFHELGHAICGNCRAIQKEFLNNLSKDTACRKCGKRFILPDNWSPLEFSSPLPTFPELKGVNEAMAIGELTSLILWMLLMHSLIEHKSKDVDHPDCPYLYDLLSKTSLLKNTFLASSIKTFGNYGYLEVLNAKFDGVHNELNSLLPGYWEWNLEAAAPPISIMPAEIVNQYLMKRELQSTNPKSYHDRECMLKELAQSNLLRLAYDRFLSSDNTVSKNSNDLLDDETKKLVYDAFCLPKMFYLGHEPSLCLVRSTTHDCVNYIQRNCLRTQRDAFITAWGLYDSKLKPLFTRLGQQQTKDISDGHDKIPIMPGIAWNGNFESQSPCPFCSLVYQFPQDHKKTPAEEGARMWTFPRRDRSCAEAGVATIYDFLNSNMWKQYAVQNLSRGYVLVVLEGSEDVDRCKGRSI